MEGLPCCPTVRSARPGKEQLPGHAREFTPRRHGAAPAFRLAPCEGIDADSVSTTASPDLRHLPADKLKLDRSLTADVDRDPRAAAIVRHTVALAHDLGLDLVAEGVEDVETAGVLAALGCDVVQGFVFARPMPVDDFLTWLDRPARPPLRPAGTS
jgi:diguanylate cyclase